MPRLVPVSQRAFLKADDSTMLNYATSYVGDLVEYDRSLLNAVLETYGFSNTNIAMDVTGANSKRDTAYKTVMRGLQNLRTGKHSPKYEDLIIGLALDIPEIHDDLLLETARNQGGNLNVSFSAEVKISETIETRTIHASLSGDGVAAFLESALTDNFDGYNFIAIAGGYPALDQVFSPVTIVFG